MQYLISTQNFSIPAVASISLFCAQNYHWNTIALLHDRERMGEGGMGIKY